MAPPPPGPGTLPPPHGEAQDVACPGARSLGAVGVVAGLRTGAPAPPLTQLTGPGQNTGSPGYREEGRGTAATGEESIHHNQYINISINKLIHQYVNQ